MENNVTELSQNVNGQNGQIDQNKLFEQFYNDDSLDPSTVGKTEEAPAEAAAPVENQVEPTGQPAPQSSSGSEEAERKEVVAEQPPSQPDPNDWLSTLPEAARKNVENLAKQASLWQQRHQEQASEKRRVLNELNQLKKKVEAPKAPEHEPDAEVDDVWNQLKEADPILYKALDKKLRALEGKLAGEAERKVQEKLQPIEYERREAFVQEQLGALEATVPNWREVTSDPYWKMWLDSQTPGTQAMFNSPYAADSIRLLKLYADDMERMFGQQQPQQVAQPAQQPVVASNPQAQQVDQARQQKLAKTAPLPAAPAGTPKAATLTQEQMFNKFYDDPDAILALLQKQQNRS